MIPSRDYGRLVDVDDTQALAEDILELSADTKARRAVAGRAYERVTQVFGLGQCVRKHRDLYWSLTSGESRPDLKRGDA